MGIFTRTGSAVALVAEPQPLTELLPGLDLAQFYTEKTGCQPDPNYFGVYAVEAIGDTLYLGIGTARPAETNGALLVKTDGKTLKVVSQLDEQGFIGMRSAGDTLYVPGADPVEDWLFGNAYTGKHPNPLVKHRNMPNVVHTFGLFPQANTGRVYAAVGQHAGDNQTFYGGVFISDDGCESWRVANDPKHILGDYRSYDVVEFGGKVYVTVNDEYGRPSRLAVSADAGDSWKRISVQVEGRPRLCLTRDYLAAQSWGRDGLVLVSKAGRVSRTRFDGFLAADWALNYLCAGYGGWYYMLADGGRLYNSRDLKNWTLVAETGLNLLSVGFWQMKNWLIVTDRGSGANIYKLDLALYGAV
jgi:hypothetical protein